MDISEIRHRNFCFVISKLERMGITKRRDQGARLGGFLSASYLSQLLAGKYMGDEVARKICQALGLPNGWLDQPQWQVGEVAPSQDDAMAFAQSIHVQRLHADSILAADPRQRHRATEAIHAIDLEPIYIRAILGSMPSSGRLVLFSGHGDSMMPIIQPGEVFIVDTAITEFNGDGLYLITTGKCIQIKGLQERGQTVYVVSANALYPPFPLDDCPIKGKVCLRNRLDRLS